jgi:hypothetical protein
MATTTSSHFIREQSVLTDLEASFPNFTGKALSWVHNSDDPPDFIAKTPAGVFGLEFREWLDEQQMNDAQGRDRQRKHLMTVIAKDWEREYQPKNILLASIDPRWGLRIASSDENLLRQEFHKCVAEVDRGWLVNPERIADRYHQMTFPTYPLMGTYFQAINYTGGSPLGVCWIQPEEDGGAYDSMAPVRALEDALEAKLAKFAKPGWQARLAKHNLVEHYLLIHGGWNAYKSNTPLYPLRLEQMAKRGAEFYATHQHRDLFNRVWFFDSLDSADDINALFGWPAGMGRVRWLAQLWPTFTMHEGSKC